MDKRSEERGNKKKGKQDEVIRGGRKGSLTPESFTGAMTQSTESGHQNGKRKIFGHAAILAN